MRIGIKYCGGCNPTNSRTESVRKLTEKYPEIDFEPIKEHVHYDAVLIINGCKCACASHQILNTNTKLFLNSIEDFDNLSEGHIYKGGK